MSLNQTVRLVRPSKLIMSLNQTVRLVRPSKLHFEEASNKMLNESRAGLTSFTNQIYRFLLKVYPPCFWRTCPPCFLSAGCVAEWRGVFGKSSCWERNANQSLSVMPMEHDIQAVIPTTKGRD
jgi:hypothetical protein